jgi:hypothetical protein
VSSFSSFFFSFGSFDGTAISAVRDHHYWAESGGGARKGERGMQKDGDGYGVFEESLFGQCAKALSNMM